MKRNVQPEILDTLSPGDPRAVHSRRDLRRINWWMRHHAIMAQALGKNLSAPPKTITELGAGDGDFLLRLAQEIQMMGEFSKVRATLLDLQPNVSALTLKAFEQLGWRASATVTDVFDWPPIASDLVIANLFLHHFEDARLAELLRLVSERTNLFIALEPRRARWPLFCSRLLWAIGCNDVTRHDAVVSIRAGFANREISALWPDQKNWLLTEHRSGLFSHLFIARRRE
ncbi:MAG: class I SAM-dependent methyltransferase [Verrucomicrobiae bacterium]